MTIDEFSIVYREYGEVVARLRVSEMGDEVYRVFLRYPELSYWLSSMRLSSDGWCVLCYGDRLEDYLPYCDVSQMSYTFVFVILFYKPQVHSLIDFSRVSQSIWGMMLDRIVQISAIGIFTDILIVH